MPAMQTHRLVALVGVVLLAVGCASNPSRPVRTEFEDIPVPKGLALLEDRSTVIESPSVKAARLLYRGRLEPASLGTAMRVTLEANGWRNVSATTAEARGTTQVYEKAGNSLQVRIWEGWYFTYVELTGSRALVPASAASRQ
jgi:hypothetical protein